MILIQILCLSIIIVATIGPDQGITHYNVTERLDESVWIPIRLTGQKGPGRECVVSVMTMDGTATGKYSL